MGEKIRKEYALGFKMRIGAQLWASPVVGSIGDDLRMDYTAIGDTTNLAFRIEDCGKAWQYSAIQSYPQALQKISLNSSPWARLQVKGKEEVQEALS